MGDTPHTATTTIHPDNLELADEFARKALRDLRSLQALTEPGSNEWRDVQHTIDTAESVISNVCMSYANHREAER